MFFRGLKLNSIYIDTGPKKHNKIAFFFIGITSEVLFLFNVILRTMIKIQRGYKLVYSVDYYITIFDLLSCALCFIYALNGLKPCFKNTAINLFFSSEMSDV